MSSNTNFSRLAFGCMAVLSSMGWAGCGAQSSGAQLSPDAAGTTGGSSSGGSTSMGGAVTTGGAVGSGGAVASGGAVTTGGAITTGGAVTTGGTIRTGGATTTGGTVGSGGAVGSGGTRGTGGATGSGGAVATGGASATGGTIGTGGSTGTGGAGGMATGGSTAVRDAGPDLARDSTGPTGTDATYPLPAGKATVYLAGDSTVSTYTTAQAPQQGWGQRLQEFFTSDVIVVNKAMGGRSSKSFVDEGRLTEILAVIKPGDYLFAQWGINDRSVSGPARATDPATTFRTYLKMYIDGARGKNAIPVLVTPTPRHQYSGGVFQNGFPEYCAAIIAVGKETNTLVIDLQAKGLAYYTSVGDAYVTSTISLDALHFKTEGAYQMARLVAQGVVEINVPISQYVIQSKLTATTP